MLSVVQKFHYCLNKCFSSFSAIGLYHLPIARVGNDGVVSKSTVYCSLCFISFFGRKPLCELSCFLQIMSGEPKKEQVFYKKFIWSQFDKINQRLFVVYFRKHGKISSGHATYKPFLIAYQFDSNTAVQFMVSLEK